MRSSAYECRLAETHHARRLRLLGSPPDLVHSGPVVQGPHPYAEPRSKALSDLVCSTAQLGAYRYFIILCPELQGAFVWVCFFFIYDLNPPTAHSGAPAACGGGPLALSQFSLRAAVRPCENWSAAPASPRCICRRQRSAQLPPSGGGRRRSRGANTTTASSGRSRELCLAQRSGFCKRAPSRAAKIG